MSPWLILVEKRNEKSGNEKKKKGKKMKVVEKLKIEKGKRKE